MRAEHTLFLHTPLQCGKLPTAYQRTQFFTEYLLGPFCKLLYQDNVCRELNIYKDSLSSSGDLVGMQEIGFFGKLPISPNLEDV